VKRSISSLFTMALAANTIAAQGPIAADSALSARSAVSGYASALGEAAANDGVLVYPGAPVIWSRPAIQQLLAAQPMLDSITVRLVPVHFEMSRDSTLAAVYGIAVAARRTPGAEPVSGWYANIWRRQVDGSWRLAAAVQSGFIASRAVVIPPLLASAPHPAMIAGASEAPFSGADIAFAALARSETARVAFERFASPQGASVGGEGTLLFGPAQIGESLAGSEKQEWVWAPIAVGASPSGDLGYTVGEATIGPRAGAAGTKRYSKYLTIWRKLPDGSVRYIFDAGNLRPAPK